MFLNENNKTMTSKNFGGLLMKLVLLISYYFSKKLTCVSLCHKDLQKKFPHESKYKEITLNTFADN